MMLLGRSPKVSVISAPNDSTTSYITLCQTCLLYTSDAADERSSVDLGGRRIIKKKKKLTNADEGSKTIKNKHQS